MATDRIYLAPGYRLQPAIELTLVDGEVTAQATAPHLCFEDFQDYEVGASPVLDAGAGFVGTSQINSTDTGAASAIEEYTDFTGATSKRLVLQNSEAVFRVPWLIKDYEQDCATLLFQLEDTGANISGELWFGVCAHTRPLSDNTVQPYLIAWRFGDAAFGTSATFTRTVAASGQVYYTTGARFMVRRDPSVTYSNSAAAPARGINAGAPWRTSWIDHCIRNTVTLNNSYQRYPTYSRVPTESPSKSATMLNGVGIYTTLGTSILGYSLGNAATAGGIAAPAAPEPDSVFVYWRDHGGTAKLYLNALAVQRQRRTIGAT